MLASMCAAPGCTNLIGLNGFSVAGLGGESEGRIGSDAGNGGSMSGGSAGSAGSADAAGEAGAAGEIGPCAASCDDGNECTTETCVDTQCVITAIAAGEVCSKGVCNGTVPEKCVACADTAPPSQRDAGCTAALPICDPMGNASCYACTEDADCATDNVSCTVEECKNHVCGHVPTDSKCPASVDACSPSKCDAAAGCTTVVISPTTQSLIAADPGKGNGSFEAGSKPATGWEEDGPYFITKNCSSGCIPGSNGGATYPSTGKALAWFGGIADAGFGDLNRVISLPVGAVSLRVQADTNFQTASSSTNAGYLEVRLMDAGYVQIGSALYSKSAQAVQVGDSHAWTANGIDVTADVKALAGKDVSVSFHSFTDPQQLSDFFVDNVRVSVTFCQ